MATPKIKRGALLGAGLAVVVVGASLGSSTVRGKIAAAYRGFSDPSLVGAPSSSASSAPPELSQADLEPLDEQPDLEGDYDLIDPDQKSMVGLEGVVPSLSDLPIPLTNRTMRYVGYFGADEKGRDAFFKRFRRAARYREHIEQRLRDASIPEDVLWLAAIESGFNPQAASPKEAMGLFQFIPETGARFGLAMGPELDERRSVTKSTDAAVAYLGALYEQFGSWDLALAAYNCGEGRLESAIERGRTTLGRSPDEPVAFHELADLGLLPRETANFVPQIHAFAIVAHNRGLLSLDDLDPLPGMQFAEIAVPPGAPLSAIARAAGISVSTLRDYNPDLLADRLPTDGGDLLVNVPADRLERTLSSLPFHLDDASVATEGEAPVAAGSTSPVAAVTPRPARSDERAPAVTDGPPKAAAKAPKALRAAPGRPGAFLLDSGVIVEVKTDGAKEVEVSAHVDVLDPLKGRKPTGEAFDIAAVRAAPDATRKALDETNKALRTVLLGDASRAMRGHLVKGRKRLYERGASEKAFFELSSRAFSKGHPMYGAVLVGPTEPADDMFLEIEPTWALDAVVTVRGPVEAKSIATDLEAAFATAFVPARPAPLPATSKGSVGTSEKRIVVAWSSSPTSDKQETAAHLAFMLACHNRMGRVHRALRHDRTVVVRLNCSLEVSPSASVAWFSAMPSLPYTAADVDKFIDAAVAPLGSDGPTDAELRAARALLRTELARELQTATLRGLPKHRVADRNQALLRHVDDVGRAEVVAAARAMFSKDHRIVVVADD